MSNPRNIVRASITALMAAVFVSSAIGAQADSGRMVFVNTDEVGAVTEPLKPVNTTSLSLTARNSVKAINVALPKHREFRAAASKGAGNLSGFKPSMYRGRHFNKADESLRECIIARESRANYDGKGGGNLDGIPGGDYQGAYQMTPDLARGVTYMMAKESKRTKDGLLSEARSLRNVPANKWSRYWQDRAFYTILNFEKHRSGAKHWDSTRHRC